MMTNRRAFLGGAAALAASPAVLRARQTSAQATPAGTPGAPLVVGTPEAQLEIFSWWTSGGEAAGLEQLFAAFSAGSPSVEVVNAAVAGGAGSNAQTALQTRLTGGEAPDSWQSHLGRELQSRYVVPGYCAPMTDLFAEQGWNEVFPQGVLDQLTFDGVPYVVPVGNHRGNVLFYNRSVMESNGVTVGETMTMDEFFTACDTLQAAGLPAIALGGRDTFASVQLFENTLLGVLGVDAYNALWNDPSQWSSDGVTQAIEAFARMLNYLNPDQAALTWDGAADLVGQGTAGFTSMGDWAYGQFVAQGTQDAIGWVTHPGTAGSFVAVIDGFTLPIGAPDPVNAANWLRAVGSAEAQTTFAPYKGCIPARTDVDASSFNEYLQWSAADFGTATATVSIAHGTAVTPPVQQAIFDATVQFLVSPDVETYRVTIQQAAEDDAASA
jgi:glucose/mannose transport system substrate-binding protein